MCVNMHVYCDETHRVLPNPVPCGIGQPGGWRAAPAGHGDGCKAVDPCLLRA